jgi:PST family polysaccharide transporter
LWLFAGEGAATVALIASGTLLARALLIGSCACIRLQVGWRDVVAIAWRAAIVIALTLVGTLAGRGVAAGYGHLWGFLVGSACGVALPAVAVLAWPPLLGARVITMLGRFTPPIPAQLGVYLRSKCRIG